jgi:outer membrane biosynthesis protein TonB
VRTTTRIVLIGAAGLIAAACGKDKAMSDDLKKDLDLASSSDGIALATPSTKGSQVVSAIERTIPPAPKRVAQSQRVVKHKPAPTPPAPVEAQKADVSEEVAPQPVAVAPAPADPAPTTSQRPHPIDMPSGAGTQVGRGGGSDVGRVLGGIISVVLRGGGVDGDECDPRADGRRRVPVSINSRIPPINGTFPGSGRVGRRF